MVSVGLIVNPAASQDVRRSMSLARTVDVHERVDTVARVLRGLGATNVATIDYMPEAYRVVERAVEELASAYLPLGSDGIPRLRPVVLFPVTFAPVCACASSMRQGCCGRSRVGASR